jgi:hypothetical protein
MRSFPQCNSLECPVVSVGTSVDWKVGAVGYLVDVADRWLPGRHGFSTILLFSSTGHSDAGPKNVVHNVMYHIASTKKRSGDGGTGFIQWSSFQR